MRSGVCCVEEETGVPALGVAGTWNRPVPASRQRSGSDANRAGGTKTRVSQPGARRAIIGAGGAGAGEMVAALYHVGVCGRAAETAGKTQRQDGVW